MRERLGHRLVMRVLGVVVCTACLLGQTVAPDKTGVIVTLLGSGGGPNPNPRRFGPSILVQAGGQTLLFRSFVAVRA